MIKFYKEKKMMFFTLTHICIIALTYTLDNIYIINISLIQNIHYFKRRNENVRKKHGKTRRIK